MVHRQWRPNELFHDGRPYHIGTSPLVCRTNQWTGFYMIWTSVMKDLNNSSKLDFLSLKIKISCNWDYNDYNISKLRDIN